jgi:cell wall assembly regulator SMI1
MTFDPNRFDVAWERYVCAIEKTHPAFRRYLGQGASEADIQAAEAATKATFPDDLRHLLKRHAGSIDAFALPGWELFGPARIADEWAVWEELRRTQFVPEGYDCEPNGPIKGDEWWRLGWIPFCGDGGGNHLCIDLDPADGGTAGQVISMWHDMANRDMAASSLTDFIEIIAADAEAGHLVWDEEMGGVYEAQET